MGSDRKGYASPQPCPKKSPSGHSTLECSSPSQYIRNTALRRIIGSSQRNVSQMCLTIPDSGMSASVTVSPEGATT